MATDPSENLSFSWSIKALLWLGVPLLVASLYAASALTAALSCPVLLVPGILLWHASRFENSTVGHLETLIWTFFGSATIGLAAVVGLQAVLCKILARVLFGHAQAQDYFEEIARNTFKDLTDGEKHKRAEMASKWQYFAFLLIFTFVMAGFLEECMKYIAISLARRSRRSPVASRHYFYYAVAATLGFSTVENIGFIYASRQESMSMLVLVVLERMIIGTPAHALTGAMLAAGMIRRNIHGHAISMWSILQAPTIYHGSFDFALFAVSAANGNVGWRHPDTPGSVALTLGLALGIIAVAGTQLRSNVRRLGL